jgi:RNA polymerase sigma factor (sigma-70 family)
MAEHERPLATSKFRTRNQSKAQAMRNVTSSSVWSGRMIEHPQAVKPMLRPPPPKFPIKGAAYHLPAFFFPPSRLRCQPTQPGNNLRFPKDFLFGFGLRRGFTCEMTESRELLAQYANNGSEAAFRELVTRYINFVYSTALRLVERNTQLAEDVTQVVFIDLSRMSKTLSSDTMLGGWLHQHTFHVATKAARGELRRQAREREASEMNMLQGNSEGSLIQAAPFLDEAITQLGAEDRTAILLRFFEQRDFRSVGEALGTSEDSARMRVNRAVDKLHGLLKQRGVTLSAAALGTALGTEVVTAAPAGLAGSVAGAALASAAAAGGTTATLVKLFTMTKLKFGIVSALVVAGTAIPLAMQRQSQAKLREENQALREQVERHRGTEEQLARIQVDRDELEKLRRSQSELLRLRGEVTALRSVSKAAALQPSPADRVNPGASAVPDTVPRVTRLQASIRTRIGSGNTLVTGGWVSGAGNRIFMLATPTIIGENSDQVNISTKVIEVPEAVLSKVGLDTFRAEGAESSVQQVISADQVDILLEKLQATEGANLIAAGGISTLDGRQCQVKATNEQVIDGVKLDLLPVFDMIPVISGDKKAIDITLHAGISRLGTKAQ